MGENIQGQYCSLSGDDSGYSICLGVVFFTPLHTSLYYLHSGESDHKSHCHSGQDTVDTINLHFWKTLGLIEAGSAKAKAAAVISGNILVEREEYTTRFTT